MNALDVAAALDKALHEAQNELAGAEIALLEATARAEDARGEASRLEAAVLALKGQTPAVSAEVAALSGEPPAAAVNDRVATPAEVTESQRPDIQDLSPEEFDKQRKRKQRAREKEIQDNNPLAHISCTGCGAVGKMVDSVITAPSGAIVRMMVCSSCNNQVMT